MPDIVLGERQQDSLRRLLSLEATPGSLPPGGLLDIIDRLVPSDCIVVSLSDATGCVVDQVMLSAAALPTDDPQVCDGPLMLGLVHQGTHPVERQMLRHFGITDGVTLGFRCGPDHVVQLSMDRYGQSFSDRDLAMLRMITPALQRLLRTNQTTALPTSLTMTERRVLQLVATGRSNSDIAADLYISVATVRKHLEHTYRKLGVHSRMAAVVAFAGGAPGRMDTAELADEYA
ncbi:MAG TPA: helix-turn-helix transcriptional regulator [Nocardioides sp.]|nr:helix-turn-helix transcriptional regulator [Nocardioides sp.]